MKSMFISSLVALLSAGSLPAFATSSALDSIEDGVVVKEALVVVEVVDDRDPGLTDAQLAVLEQEGVVEIPSEQYASNSRQRARRHVTEEAYAARIKASVDSSGGTGRSFTGMASYYGNEAGSRTASGQRFNQNAMTAAHRSLPFGTKLRVTHGSQSVIVTINDRGPFIKGRVLDLSTGAARVLGITGAGVARVTAEIL